MVDAISSFFENLVVLTTGNNIPSQSHTLISINLVTGIPFKLRKVNYASWRAQFTNLLFGSDLLGFLDGTMSCPFETILPTVSTTLV